MPQTDEQRAMYAEFMMRYDWCWHCGWNGREHRQWSRGELHNAHIVAGNGRRKHDRRAICRLCDACHMASHGNRLVISSRHDNCYWRGPTMAQMLWLKRMFDPSHFDLDYITHIRGQPAPPPEPPLGAMLEIVERAGYLRLRDGRWRPAGQAWLTMTPEESSLLERLLDVQSPPIQAEVPQP